MNLAAEQTATSLEKLVWLDSTALESTSTAAYVRIANVSTDRDNELHFRLHC